MSTRSWRALVVDILRVWLVSGWLISWLLVFLVVAEFGGAAVWCGVAKCDAHGLEGRDVPLLQR